MAPTVAEIKAQLRGRGVSFPSKLRKQELLNLLESNWHLPMDPRLAKEAEKPKQKSNGRKSNAKSWKPDEPVRRLLYFELREKNIPLDPNEMGPCQVYVKYHKTPEFEGIKFDDAFKQRLKSLREVVNKEEPLLKWNEYHPARALMFAEIEAGRIPMDAGEMGPAQVWRNYYDTPEFKMRGMKFNDTFKRRLVALRKLVARDKCRADDDLLDLKLALKKFPPPTHNHRGEPQWNGSEAQKLLKESVDRLEHINIKPAELRRSKPQFMEFALNTFRWKIQQEVKTRKYLHTLKHDSEQKLLRKHLGKMTIGN